MTESCRVLLDTTAEICNEHFFSFINDHLEVWWNLWHKQNHQCMQMNYCNLYLSLPGMGSSLNVSHFPQNHVYEMNSIFYKDIFLSAKLLAENA